jgi:hypothetical protein
MIAEIAACLVYVTVGLALAVTFLALDDEQDSGTRQTFALFMVLAWPAYLMMWLVRWCRR